MNFIEKKTACNFLRFLHCFRHCRIRISLPHQSRNGKMFRSIQSTIGFVHRKCKSSIHEEIAAKVESAGENSVFSSYHFINKECEGKLRLEAEKWGTCSFVRSWDQMSSGTSCVTLISFPQNFSVYFQLFLLHNVTENKVDKVAGNTRVLVEPESDT